MEKLKRIGDLLLENGKITQDQLNAALKKHKETGGKVGEILLEEFYVTEEEIIEVLKVQLNIPIVDLNNVEIDSSVLHLVDEKIARKYTVFPIFKQKNSLYIAVNDPLNTIAIDEVRVATNMDVKLFLSTKEKIQSNIDKHYSKHRTLIAYDDFSKVKKEKKQEDIDAELIKATDVNDSPVVRLLDEILKQAVKADASDIHIEPYEKDVRVLLRVDGDLNEILNIEKDIHASLVARIKIISTLNIAEKRKPQDGSVERVINNKVIDLRIATLPTVHGESIAIRLLDRSNFLLPTNELGISEKNYEIFSSIIKNPHGVVLVTGPTGSGKSTTLYSILSEIRGRNEKIITVEDPVEYELYGINQVQVNLQADLTFANALRSILRQDPDIIMVGEIRDSATAEIAIRAAITGHLVFSTLHTNDTASSVIRLIDMGIEPYLISSSVVGVISQRLIRKICPNCKVSYEPSDSERKFLGIDREYRLHRGEGCKACRGKGYKGRTAVHEILQIDEELRGLIRQNENPDIIKAKAVEKGMTTLKNSCIELVLKGTTTFEELLRVAYSIDWVRWKCANLIVATSI